ncbi:hypothetical protein [Amycolatopsis jejuensis]|uniref:hypothetical protein n=1 Tax=Amycolatopsis jejuensis TaxID=330084 RepID=UPI000526CA1B|nr:hypothetical protein [Amycolatopsis jejuensis]
MTEHDLIRASAQAGRVVVYEESPRDGAQAKTLMSADFRVKLALAQGAMFGENGSRQVVYAAGFPAISGHEREAIRKVAQEAQEAVSVSAVCRCLPQDVELGLKALNGAKNTRLLIIVGSSAEMCQLTGRSTSEFFAYALDVVKQAVQESAGEVAVDVIMGDAPRADRAQLADSAAAMTAEGAGLIVLADTTGGLLPREAGALFEDIARRAGDEVVLGSHMHNDLGLALPNTLAAMETGTRVIATSWLGFSERSGMTPTEVLVFLLTYAPKRAAELLGTDVPLWWSAPDLKQLPRITEMVSRETGVPITVTTPIVGSGVGTTSAGTHFLDPTVFHAFDQKEHLGIEQKVLLTQLVSSRIVKSVAENLGYGLTSDEITSAMAWIKDRAFRLNESVVSEDDFAMFLDGMVAGRPLASADPVT